jgi:hypothetical protein
MEYVTVAVVGETTFTALTVASVPFAIAEPA